MNKYNSRVAILLALCMLSSSSMACDSALSVARSLYKLDYELAFKSVTELRTPVSSELKELLEKEYTCKQGDYSCAIDWDMWSDSQDTEIIAPPKFSLIRQSRNLAEVRVVVLNASGEGKPVKNSLSVLLKREGPRACWEVDDLDLGKTGRLKQLLRARQDLS